MLAVAGTPIVEGEPLTGWFAGIIIGVVVILIVVIIIASLLTQLRKAAEQTRTITFALDQIRANTAALADIPLVNSTIEDINNSAVAARGVLEGLR